VAALALAGAAVAIYLTLYQWRLTTSVWDPLFGAASSEAVLTSFVSRLLPLPDATLGALAYVAEALASLLGGEQRWRTHPALVALGFGGIVGGLAATSLVLVLAQLLLVRAACTLCLVSAAISFVNVWLARCEVLASLRCLVKEDQP
jgi:uncharacterized membrane protein